MKRDILKQYVTLRTSLARERGQLLARLKQVEAALGGDLSAAEAKAPGKAKRRVSAAGRRAISRAAKARWAKLRAAKARKAGAKPKKRFSAAARAALSAAAKARWAKVKAAGKTKL